MIHKSFRRRPELDAMESKLMLSGATAVHLQPPAALLAAVERGASPAVTVFQWGAQLRGQYKTDVSSPPLFIYSATGTIPSIGKATVTGSIDYALEAPSGTATIATKRGKIFAQATTMGIGQPIYFQITRGTDVYVAATGEEVAMCKLVPAKGRHAEHGKITIIFNRVNN
jgi:hypothetical protein